MTTFNASMPDLAALQQQLLGRFERFRRRVRTHMLVEGVARVLAVVVGVALLSFVLDRIFRLGLTSRLIFTAMGVALIVWQLRRHIIRPLRLPLNPVDLATTLDRRQVETPSVAGGKSWSTSTSPIAARVATVLQLPELMRDERPPSETMIRRAVQRSYESLENIDLDSSLDERRRNGALGAIAALILLPILLALAFPSSASLWAKRWLAGSSQAWPQKTYLVVADLNDGRILVPRGEPSVLRVGVKDGSIDPETVSLTLRIGRGKKTIAQMNRFGPGDYRYDLPPLQNEATVELTGGDDDFGPFRVEPVDRPRVVELALSSQHPTQAAPEIHRFSGVDADLAFLPKT